MSTAPPLADGPHTALATGPARVLAAGRAAHRAKLVSGLAMTAFGIYGIFAFGLGLRTGNGAESIFVLKQYPTDGGPGPASMPAGPVAIVLSSIAVLCGAARAFAPARTPLGRPSAARWLTTGYFLTYILAFLVWAVAGSNIGLNVPNVLVQTLAAAVPLTLGACSGLLCERSGVVNVAIEGQFLFGAFASAMAATMTGSVWAGILAGMLGGVLLGALLAVLANRYLIEQVVLGVVLNLFASGLTGFLYDRLMSANGPEYNQPPLLAAIKIPGLARIPVIGPVFQQNILFYAAYLLVPVLWFLLYRTRWGLRTRAVGEHPLAADTVGVKVLGLRYRNVILAGLLSGLGGAWMTIGTTGPFGKDLSNGRGYIALAALIVGRWSPVGAMAAAILFGFATALNLVLNPIGTPIPSAFLAMAPYLATIFVVAALGGQVRPPAAENKPFVKG
jgi:general nucleoside transport system permease protein